LKVDFELSVEKLEKELMLVAGEQPRRYRLSRV